MKRLNISSIVFAVLLVGCAGLQRECSGCAASNLGADWIVLQYGFDGKPINCWKLNDTAIDNETSSDGIYWLAKSGHLVHISGWYNRVQISGNDWKGAAQDIGIELDKCHDGKYEN